jgi:hypothetical protein
MAVAVFDGAADVWGDDPLLPADVEGEPVGVEDEPADLGVAGGPAGLGGGPDVGEPGVGGAGVGGGVGEVVEVDGDHDMWLHGAADGQ